MADHIWDRKTGEQIAWIENDHDVYSVATKQKFATVYDGKLYALNGKFLNLYLDHLHADGADLAISGRDIEAAARLKTLASQS
jgi:hypothetical protein